MYEAPNHAAAIAGDDNNNLGSATSWLSFSNTGAQTLKIDTVGGETGVSLVLPSGMYPIRAKKVYSTGTTVTNIIGYW